MKCLNCGTALSCGCQKRTASNGASVCTNCLATHEKKLKENLTNAPKVVLASPSKTV